VAVLADSDDDAAEALATLHERDVVGVARDDDDVGDVAQPEHVGVIEEDPGSAQPRDLASYDEIQAAGGLRLLVRHGSADRKLIVVCPRLEDWLIARAVSSGIRLQDYGLPGDPHRLHGIPHYEDRQTFQQFLTELTGRDAEGMGLLRQWVQQAK
jgi:hypothetical protein